MWLKESEFYKIVNFSNEAINERIFNNPVPMKNDFQTY